MNTKNTHAEGPPIHANAEIPRGNAAGFIKYFQRDLLSGFLVFLIALPLCLGISLASGYPPMAGIFTAIIGAIVTTFISNSELTIKGPAAGLIVIALGCIEEFGGNGFIDGFSQADANAYRAALAVGVIAAVMQMIFAIFRAGILGEFFPLSTVHGMLAAIGVIIITKQFPVVLGSSESIKPLEIFSDTKDVIQDANPVIAIIGVTSLLIMFLWPLVKKRVRLLSYVPAPLVVALVAVPMGMAFDLQHPHSYELNGHEFELSESYLVAMPDRMFGMFEKITYPDFSVIGEAKTWKWAFLFFIIGTLESVLSAKAVDLIDPWQRKTNIDRDIMGVGVANLGAAMVGGLPMISEIVRSRANIDNGARTRFANFWHGILLLVCVALIPTVLHLLPLAALAAMLVYTGYRLAHPTEFLHVYRIGREQLVIFVSTLVGVLMTDLLIGVGIGIAVKLAIHMMNGVPLRAVFKLNADIEARESNSVLIRPHDAAVFSNWIPFRRQIETIGLNQGKNIQLDMSEVRLIDHSVMDRLHEMQRDFRRSDLKLEITGLNASIPLSNHEQSARKRGLPRMKRVTAYTDALMEDRIVHAALMLGINSYTSVSCRGSTSSSATNGSLSGMDQVRMEFIVPPEKYEEFLRFFRIEFGPEDHVDVCVETIEVLMSDVSEPSLVNSH